MGINLQPAHPDCPTDKPKIERTLQSVGTTFAQYVAGYVGSSVERRGKNAEADAASRSTIAPMTPRPSIRTGASIPESMPVENFECAITMTTGG